ncbi:MAG: MarR family transcriptional regulator [Clostridia bacterium]|nr:MarR family transcriptional regulator [Clostridia bacterium]
MPLSHFQVLSLLEERGSMSVSEISDYFDIAKPNITPLVDRLVGAGLVDRVRSNTDRRVVFIVILDEGRARLNAIREMLTENVEEWKNALTDEEFQLLAESMGNVVALLKKI